MILALLLVFSPNKLSLPASIPVLLMGRNDNRDEKNATGFLMKFERSNFVAFIVADVRPGEDSKRKAKQTTIAVVLNNAFLDMVTSL